MSQIGATKSLGEPQETQSEARRKGEDSVEYCEPGKTHAESYSQGEPKESLSEPQAAQYKSGKGRETHLSLVSQKGLSRV